MLDQLMALGTIGQRRQGAQQLAAGVPVDYSKGKGLPLLLAGLANMGSAAYGGYREGKLNQEQTSGRSALMSMLGNGLPVVDPEKGAPAGYADQVSGLRRSGLAALLSGDPQAGAVGKQLMGEAEQGQQTLQGLPAAAIQQRLARTKVGQMEAENSAAQAPETEAALRATIAKMMPGVDLSGVAGAALRGILPIAEKAYGVDQAAQARRDVAKLNGDTRRDVANTPKPQAQKQIPARQAERYAQLRSTIQAIDPYMSQLDQAVTGPIAGRLNALNPLHGGPTAGAMATEEALKMKLARALHGGVPTKTEIEAASAYIPSIKDTKEQREAKRDSLAALFRDEEGTLKETYGEVGLNTSNLSTSDAAPVAAPAVRKFTRGPDGKLVEVK
jgi:hypothetical protein